MTVTQRIAHEATQPAQHRERALRILAKTIYRQLRENGFAPKEIVTVSGELISLVTEDVRPAPSTDDDPGEIADEPPLRVAAASQ